MSRDRIWSDKAVEGEHSKVEKVLGYNEYKNNHYNQGVSWLQNIKNMEVPLKQK